MKLKTNMVRAICALSLVLAGSVRAEPDWDLVALRVNAAIHACQMYCEEEPNYNDCMCEELQNSANAFAIAAAMPGADYETFMAAHDGVMAYRAAFFNCSA